METVGNCSGPGCCHRRGAASGPFPPALLIGFAGLAWAARRRRTARRAFFDGWLFGTGYFAASLYWLGNAFLVDANRFAWMIPLAVLGVPALLGFLSGFATLVASRFSGLMQIAALAACWTLSEWARGVLLTGFPWNPVGNVWVAIPPVMQAASWFGVYGLSLVTVFAAASTAAVVDHHRRIRLHAVSGFCLLALLAALGAFRMSSGSPETVDGVRLRLVQPAISQEEKWRTDRKLPNFRRLRDLSHSEGSVTHVIWPEAALPFILPVSSLEAPVLSGAVPQGVLILTGAVKYQAKKEKSRTCGTASSSPGVRTSWPRMTNTTSFLSGNTFRKS